MPNNEPLRDPWMDTGPHQTALTFLRRLTRSEENGAIVSSAACSEMEITFARAEGRFWVDPETSCGFVLRPKRWRELAEQSKIGVGAHSAMAPACMEPKRLAETAAPFPVAPE